MSIQVLHSFSRGERESVRVEFKEYKGKFYVDMRVYFQPEGAEEMLPTKKGLTIPLENLNDLKKAITSCEKDFSFQKTKFKT